MRIDPYNAEYLLKQHQRKCKAVNEHAWKYPKKKTSLKSILSKLKCRLKRASFRQCLETF
jgi:hypothetical protein